MTIADLKRGRKRFKNDERYKGLIRGADTSKRRLERQIEKEKQMRQRKAKKG